MGVEEKDITGSEHSKPTTPTSDSGAGNVAESQADTIEPDKSSLDDRLDSQADAATLDSVEMAEDLDAAEKEPLASTSGTGKNKHKSYTSGTVSNSASADDLISEDNIITKSRFDEDDSERLNTCTEDFESQVSDNGGSKKSWDVRCVVIGILILLMIVAGAVAAIIAHRFKGPPLLYDFKFASFFGDGMVLQRAPHKAVVWGYGPILNDNTTVKVTISSDSYEKDYVTHVKSRVQGQIWKVSFDEVNEAGPYKIVATLDTEPPQEIYIEDVLFGDVFVCAGQFDMEFKLRKLYNTTEVLGLENLRLLGLTPHKSNFPRYDTKHLQVPWTSAANLNVGYQAHFPKLCYDYGKAMHEKVNRPIGLVSMAFSDSVIEEWTPHRSLHACDIKTTDSSSTVWHGMVTPLMNMAFHGAIWYQGELDATELKGMFNCTFLRFIDEWRNHTYKHTHGSTDRHFPFGIIQLPPNRTAEHTGYARFTDIRWSQTANYGRVPNSKMRKVFMAATIDLPEADADRPEGIDANEIIVRRLVRGTMGVAYRQRNVTFQGPFPTQYRVENDRIILHLDNNSANVEIRSEDGFEICCSHNEAAICLSSFTKAATVAPDREWVKAPITKLDRSSIAISRGRCTKPYAIGIRYAWAETPCQWEKCGVYDANTELPMAPYIKQFLKNDGQKHDLPFEQINLL